MPNFKPRLALILSILGLCLLVFSVYGQILSHQFLNWDDDNYVVNNTNIEHFGSWMLTSLSVSNWHPLTWFSYTLDYALFGLSPWGFHLSNLILHLLNSLLVFGLFLWGLGRFYPDSSQRLRYLAAIIAAALFAVHPQHVEVVSWVSERKELLCFFFSISSLWLFLLSETRRSAYLWSLLFFLLALSAKAMAVTLPLLFFLWDWQRGKAFWLNFQEKLPFFILSLIVAVLTILAQSDSSAIISLSSLSIEERLLNAAHSLFFYLQKWLMPLSLSPYYIFPSPLSWHNPQIISALVAILAISGFCVVLWRKQKYNLVASWIFYIVALIPVLGLLQVGSQAAADRYAYLPTLGFYWLLALALISWPTYRRWLLLFLSLWGLGLGLIAYQQATLWQHDFSLWRYAVLNTPQSITAHVKLANTYMRLQKYGLAERHYQAAIHFSSKGSTQRLQPIFKALKQAQLKRQAQ